MKSYRGFLFIIVLVFYSCSGMKPYTSWSETTATQTIDNLLYYDITKGPTPTLSVELNEMDIPENNSILIRAFDFTASPFYINIPGPAARFYSFNYGLGEYFFAIVIPAGTYELKGWEAKDPTGAMIISQKDLKFFGDRMLEVPAHTIVNVGLIKDKSTSNPSSKSEIVKDIIQIKEKDGSLFIRRKVDTDSASDKNLIQDGQTETPVFKITIPNLKSFGYQSAAFSAAPVVE
jgi:hypothetical protein